MTRFFILSLFICITLSNCDVRKKDVRGVTTTDVPASLPDTLPKTQVQIIDSVYNFGQIQEGEKVEHQFQFKNIGTHNLVIRDARASCGCTVPEKPKYPIKPGETGYIKATFDSKNRPGQAHKTITVTSNADPAFPTLMLEGEVIGKKE